MASANQPRLKRWLGRRASAHDTAIIEYLPDADEIERSPLPPYARITLHVLLGAMLMFGIWACFAKVDQVVTARGRLVTPLPNVVVQPLETAVIQRVNVRVGQVVKKGEQLAMLDPTFAEADESQMRNMLASLETQIAGLRQELAGENVALGGTDPAEPAGATDPAQLADTADAALAGQPGDAQLQAELLNERRANYRAQKDKLEQTAAKLRAALATNAVDQRETAARLSSLRQMQAMQERMVAQKYAAPLAVLEARQRTEEVARELGLAVSREKELRRELDAFEDERTAFEKGWRQKTMEDLLSITRSRDSIHEQLQKANRRQQLLTLVSPIDGVVLEIAKLSPGSVVREAETFFTLVPLGVPLEAEVQIDAAEIGNIKVGHAAQVKVDAFPFQQHGTLDASVRTLSQDSFRRESPAKTDGDAYYTSRIALKQTQLRNMKPGAALLPGMTLSVEIAVGQRSVMSYLAWPLTKGLGEAIREP
jgi:HlyD family secretion protein